MIYLDYAAHAPADPAVLERFCDVERVLMPIQTQITPQAGPRASKWPAQPSRIASLTGAAPSEVIFTSGATEANNLAIKGIGGPRPHRQAHHLHSR